MKCIRCGDDVDSRRWALGYKVCLWCGEDAAREQRLGWCIAPMNKSNYTLITDPTLLKQLNPKRTT